MLTMVARVLASLGARYIALFGFASQVISRNAARFIPPISSILKSLSLIDLHSEDRFLGVCQQRRRYGRDSKTRESRGRRGCRYDLNFFTIFSPFFAPMAALVNFMTLNRAKARAVPR